ncbi:MAG: hypothetical protein ACXVLX_05295, partial [Ilumatobacteraceae bacterium]
MTDDQHDQLPLAVAPATAQVDAPGDITPPGGEADTEAGEPSGDTAVRSAAQKRRRGSRGGRNRKKPGTAAATAVAEPSAEGERKA